jgi:hypothetical protein
VRPKILSHYAQGTLTWAELWRNHNEHRIFFPELVMLGLGILAHGNVTADMYVSEALLGVLLAVFLFAARKQLPQSRAAWLMVPIAFLVFNFRQHDNMLWAFQITFLMTATFSVLTLFFLSRIREESSKIPLLGAAVTGVVAAFSSAQGLLVWPIGLMQIIIAPLAKRRKIVTAATWGSFGLGVWLSYFHGYQVSADGTPYAFSAEYLLLSIGGALASDTTVALIVGVLLLALTVAALSFVIVRRQWQTQSFWLACLAYSLAALGAMMIGRCGFGARQAMMSRYATFSMPLVVAVYVLIASQCRDRVDHLAERLLRGALILTMVAVGICFFRGFMIGSRVRCEREAARQIFATMDSQSDQTLVQYYPDVAEIRRDAAELRRMQYSFFAESAFRDGVEKTGTPLIVAEERGNLRR